MHRVTKAPIKNQSRAPASAWQGLGRLLMLASCAVVQAHELSSAALKGLTASSGLGALSLEGIPRMGQEGWRALSSLTALTRLAVRSRGDNAGLAQATLLTYALPPNLHIFQGF